MANNKSKKKAAKRTRLLIATAVVVLLVLFLLNPDWLPFISQQTRDKIVELERTHFLIERSGQITSAHILTLVLAICVIWFLYTVIKQILIAVGKRDRRAKTVTNMLVGAVKYLAVIVSVIWGLSILGVNSTAVLAGVGIIGLILGFGAQSLIEDIITGLFIIFEGKYSIGDIIVLDDFRGVVRDIGVRTTTIEDAGYNLKVVNNSDIRNFQNRSRNTSLAVCEVSVSYETDLRKLDKLLEKALPPLLEQHKDLYLTVPRLLGVTELADSGVNLKFVVDVQEENIFVANRALTKDIRLIFADNGVEIPFPQLDIHNK